MLYTPKKEFEKQKTRAQLMQYAIWLLGQRDYFSAGLFSKLKSYALDNRDADIVLEKMVDLNYINDDRLVEMRVRNASEYPSKGPIRIRQELLNKGSPSHLVDQYLALVDHEIWEENCKQLYLNRYRKDWDTMKERNKRVRYLVSRGFNFDSSIKVTSQSIEGHQSLLKE
jgi:regulatory protein